MIFASTHSPESQGILEDGIRKALAWAASTDMAALETGPHTIDGDDLFVNVIEYTTKNPEERFWEAHKEYLDLHFPIRGEEQIDLALLEDLKAGDYDFLVCYPQDVHRTAVAVNGQPETIKKAVFKIRIA